MLFCRPFRIQIQYRYTPNTKVILLLIRISISDTVQIRTRHGCHSVIHWKFIPFPEILLTRMFFCRPFRIQIQYRYTPDTEVILIFIQESNTVTTRIRPRHGHHSFAHRNPISRYDSDTFQIRIPIWCSFS